MVTNSTIDGAYSRPTSLASALDALDQRKAVIVSGCTDFYPSHVGRNLPSCLLDVSAIEAMRGITVGADCVSIGGAVTWSEIAEAKLPSSFAALQNAARQVGSLQVQNRGTIAGNICNASPAADGIPPLLILDAQVELTSNTGMRRMPLCDFIVGYRRTALGPGEILSAVIVPLEPADATSSFVKLGARKYLVISIVMVAALLRVSSRGKIAEARVALGSASEKALRLGRLERDLVGLDVNDILPDIITPDHLSDLKPIDDVRASAAYRIDAAQHVIHDAIKQAAGR